MLIRKLWDAGLAHRDIKPGNLMVRDGELLLIDAAFAQVRPSPWRQAVDLGNMMLVLAVRTDAERVYRRALDYFTPDELAEAFAATRGVASPTQLRAFMKRDPRDLLGEFRALAPPRRPIGLQRWGARRVIVAAAMLGAALLAADLAVDAFQPAVKTVTAAPFCGTGHAMILSAQAVPSSATAAVRRGPAIGLDRRVRRHHERPLRVLAELRPGRPAGGHRHPDRHLRHLRSGADPIRPARSASVSNAR